MLESIHKLGTRFALLTDDVVGPLYSSKIMNQLPDVLKIEIPSGEEQKTRFTKEKIEDILFSHGFGRDSCLIALGGGVICDLAGFIAATYCRGISLVLYPTTLLAMADASIGGKTAVNTPFGKNMIGCFYAPHLVIRDLTVLNTLPGNEFKNGLVEMLKHGLIADKSYYYFLQKGIDQILDFKFLEPAIDASVRIKTSIVEEDFKDQGKRHFLNFGHTIGHAIENLSHYKISHGQAVARGIIVESAISYLLGHLSLENLQIIKEGLENFATPIIYSYKEMKEALILDKKSKKTIPHFVLLKEIGEPLGCFSVEESIISEAINWSCHALLCH